MTEHDWWVISLVIVLVLMGTGAIIGGVLAAKLAILYIYGNEEN